MAAQAQFRLSPNALALHLQANRPTDDAIKDERQLLIAGGAVLSDPKSDLTCNIPFELAPPTRKRNRDAAAVPMDYHHQQSLQIPIPSKFPKIVIADGNGFEHQNRTLGSAGASTSGRPILPPASQHVSEVDALIRLHNAKLTSALNEIQSRHCVELLKAIENQAAKRIAEKDAEIEMVKRKHAELESRLKQVAAEGQIWFSVAANSEAIASNLRASLDQALRRVADGGGCHVAGAGAEDAESCCYEGDAAEIVRSQGSRSCRACRARDVSVLLLPCRHLCLCAECEPAVDTCPICCAAKKFGLQICME